MTRPKDSNLQVRIDAVLLGEFRQYAEDRGTTMSRMMLSWIRGAVGGSGEPGRAMQRSDSRSDRGHDSEELVLLGRRQVELLELLVASSAPGIAGSAMPAEEGVRSVVLTEEAPMGGDEVDDLSGSVSSYEMAEGDEMQTAMENWLSDLRAGGEPVAPPLGDDAPVEEWEIAAAECLRVRGKEVTVELVETALKYWGRD